MASQGRGGKKKGADYERKLCRTLSAWWLDRDFTGVHAANLPIRRSRGSGGWDHRIEPGDIALIREGEFADAPEFPFAVEAKNKEGWDFNTLVQGNKDWVGWTWWKQCRKAAKVKKVIPWLIFTRNNQPNYAMLPMVEYAYLFDRNPRALIIPKRRVIVPSLASILETPAEKVRQGLGSEINA